MNEEQLWNPEQQEQQNRPVARLIDNESRGSLIVLADKEERERHTSCVPQPAINKYDQLVAVQYARSMSVHYE